MNLKKIKDNSVLVSGTYTAGNVNDFANLVNRCCPSLNPALVDNLQETIEKVLKENGKKSCTYCLSSEAPKRNLLHSEKVGEMILSFF